MTNNTSLLPHLSTETLEAVLAHREVHFPGTIRQAETLLKVDYEHRLTIDAEAHLAANMAGGRVSDHRDAIVRLYLGSSDRELYVQNLRDGQRRIATNKRF